MCEFVDKNGVTITKGVTLQHDGGDIMVVKAFEGLYFDGVDNSLPITEFNLNEFTVVPDLVYDRVCKCDWCGIKRKVRVTQYGTTHYNRLICPTCETNISAQHGVPNLLAFDGHDE